VIDRIVAVGAIVAGVTGMVLHLKSAFFQEQTLGTLVYSAPFIAPLAYVGVGLLLLLVRLEAPESPAFGWWIVLLALGGFVGNLGMSLLDHAQNGLFRWTEWVRSFRPRSA
jgi:ABC-type spermidine/putrescine transport system permease subunit II